MLINDDVAAALPELRAQAESLMVDTCIITRPAAGTSWNDTTGQYDPATPATIYSGKCRFQTRDVQPGDPSAGETVWATFAFVVQVPVAVVGVQIGDLVTVTASTFDADLPGRKLRVIGLVHKTHLTARRLVCEEVQ